LFNSNPNTEGDEFLVDVITTMGRAALVVQLSRIAPLIVGALVSIGTVLGLLVWKRRQRRK